MQNQNTHAMLNIASRLTRQANHCQNLLVNGLGIPVTLVEGREANKRDAIALLTRLRKLRLARQLTGEAMQHGTQTDRFDMLNTKLVAMR